MGLLHVNPMIEGPTEARLTPNQLGFELLIFEGVVPFPLVHPLARGVTVARLTLDQLVLVRIQAGQQRLTSV